MLAIFRISITILWPLCQGFVPFHNNFVATVTCLVPNFVAPEHFAREPFLASSSSSTKRWAAMTEDEGLWAQHCHGWHYRDRSVAEPKAHGPVLQASSKVKAVKTEPAAEEPMNTAQIEEMETAHRELDGCWCMNVSEEVQDAESDAITCESSIQIPGTNRIDKQALCSNANFATMITKGWAWKVIYACIDEAFPKFAVIAQSALNVRNHVAAAMGELQVAMCLAKTACEMNRTDALQSIARMSPPCSSYADVLLDYVTKFGDKDASIIQFVDSCSKQFRANNVLGPSYWKALTHTEFASKLSKYPLVRASLLLANLTTDKIEDGVARCLSKNDVKSVALKPKMDMATAAEEHLSDAFDIVKAISTVEKCLKPLGQFFVRVALKLTGAERKGRENKIYTWHEMRNKFLADMSEVVARSSCTTNKVHQDNKFLADMSEIPSITFAKWSEAPVNDADTYKATSKASVKPDNKASVRHMHVC